MVELIFLSSQVKRSVIVSSKHDMYELPRVGERLKNRTEEMPEKSQNFIELLPSAKSPWNENFASTSKNLKKAEIEPFP